MFVLNERQEREFTGGKLAWDEAHRLAAACGHFQEDVDDEQVADESVSCYNCRYRRWTANSFLCLKNVVKKK